MLGSTTSPEQPYTWLKTFHPNMFPVAEKDGEASG